MNISEQDWALSPAGAKVVFRAMREWMLAHPEDETAQADWSPDEMRTFIRRIADEQGCVLENDARTVINWIHGMLIDHPTEAERLRSGDARMVNWFLGQIVRVHGAKTPTQFVVQCLEIISGTRQP